MVIMALDHTRDFFANLPDPVDLKVTWPTLFFTRWITHFCAPTFIFLAGVSAAFQLERGKSRRSLQYLLLTRGAWLLFLEIVVSKFSWSFNFDGHHWFAGVLWAIGWSMISLGALLWLPRAVIGFFSVFLIVIHNGWDGIQAADWGSFSWLWTLLHAPDMLTLAPGITWDIWYPILPWPGVMGLGYVLGKPFFNPEERRSLALRLGVAFCFAFIFLRAWNHYGDPNPWQPQESGLFTVMSFLNVWKYPPSLLYLLMTLGPVLILLGTLRDQLPRFCQPLVVIGRVPMFYYVVHIPLLHLLAILAAMLSAQPFLWLFEYPVVNAPKDYGWSLGMVYFFWCLTVLLLYPACRRFADLKRRSASPWLSYF